MLFNFFSRAGHNANALRAAALEGFGIAFIAEDLARSYGLPRLPNVTVSLHGAGLGSNPAAAQLRAVVREIAGRQLPPT